MSLIPKQEFMDCGIDSATYTQPAVTLIGLYLNIVEERYEICIDCNLGVELTILGKTHCQEYPLACSYRIFGCADGIRCHHHKLVCVIHTDGKSL